MVNIIQIKRILLVSVTGFLLHIISLQAKNLPNGAIPVSKGGSYSVAGATYVLTNDIVSDKSAVFLGKDVILDLNGFSITFAAGKYQNVPNSGFEQGLDGWDISKAPGARVVKTAEVHAFIGDFILSLEAGDEIISPYIDLAVKDRSYFAMCGITGRYYQDMKGDLKNDMKISIYVEDQHGNQVECRNQYNDTTMIGCPVVSRSARLGGGFIFAHLKDLPAGKYRVRVKAETDCLIDEIDIRPAMDVGVGIVGKTHPYGHYNHLYDNQHSAFYDYTADFADGTPIGEIPQVKGKGTVTIKNGTIKNGSLGILSHGIQSTADDVMVILDNVKIFNSGINATAVDVPQACITYCEFNIHNPFIINRHGSEFYAVDLRGKQSSEVAYSKFNGGQGCLVIKGPESKVHHNNFINRQTVTNHYSVMAMGDGSMIFENKFEPEIGSGLEIFRHKNIEIFNNEFIIKAAPPSCEYHDNYSTNAIRIADYGAKWGSPQGAFGNRIYNNKFHITGKKFKEYPNYIPLASAFFFSTSAGDNYIFGNEIVIDQKDPETDAEAYAFYIGNARGGQLHNNRITSNVPPIWVGSAYGIAIGTQIANNTIIKAPDAGDFKPIRMGSKEQKICVAQNVSFRSNEFNGLEFGIAATTQQHSYSVSWSLEVNAGNRDASVKITDKDGKEVVNQKAGKDGRLLVELPEYSVDGNEKVYYSPYIVTVGKKKMGVELRKNSTTDFR